MGLFQVSILNVQALGLSVHCFTPLFKVSILNLAPWYIKKVSAKFLSQIFLGFFVHPKFFLMKETLKLAQAMCEASHYKFYPIILL